MDALLNEIESLKEIIASQAERIEKLEAKLANWKCELQLKIKL